MGAAPMQVPKKNGIKCACNEKNVILKNKKTQKRKKITKTRAVTKKMPSRRLQQKKKPQQSLRL